ncbi:hypothetical protein [uncultured Microbulbifer sp.]|uniref:hypothetical protein n=1 Tax=uncultured Microbulbifer sp. TaxID=348147 RepID=UPI002612F0CA|nr:hypothetical protein [uncultured Microbulbifer sp.]
MICINDNGEVWLSYHLDMVEDGDVENLRFAIGEFAHLVERNKQVPFYQWVKLIQNHVDINARTSDIQHRDEICETLDRCAQVYSFDFRLDVNKGEESVQYEVPNVCAENVSQALEKVSGIDDFYPYLNEMKVTSTPMDKEFSRTIRCSISSKEVSGV